MKKTFSIKELLGQGWALTKEHFGLLIVATLVYFFFSSLGGVFNHNGHVVGWSIPFFLLSIVISIIIHIGYIKLYLHVFDGEHVGLSELFANYSLFWRYLGGSILVTLITMIGFVLLIIPGIYAALRFCFTAILIIDEGLGPVEAMKRSSVLTKGVKWKILLFWLVILCVNIVGAIALVVGLLATIPLSYLAFVALYRKLLAENGGAPSEEVPLDPAVSASDEPTIAA